MPNVEIRRPTTDDTEALHRFFQMMVRDTFAKENLLQYTEEIESEIENKIQYLDDDLRSNGTDRYFLLAVRDGIIIGTIEYGPPNNLIRELTQGALSHLPEIGTVFVHPSYRQQGVGSLLVNVMMLTLLSRGVEEFCLDCGYGSAQQVWMRKFGEPQYWLRDWWGQGQDHMIWALRTGSIPISLHAVRV